METETAEQLKGCKLAPDEDQLRRLGLKAAADNLKRDRDLADKLWKAYELYAVVTPGDVAAFQADLQKRTKAINAAGYQTYDVLKFVALGDYTEVPPQEALKELETAVEMGCFDTFEVAKIESHVVVPDPLLFGRVAGCDDRFFIAQWDDDVSIDQILEAGRKS